LEVDALIAPSQDEPTAAVRFDSVDDCLGPAAGRFFGAGFRHVVHRITDITVQPGDNGGGRVHARAGLRYPPDWSTKSTEEYQRPHLSSIDALLIAVRLGEIYLTHTHGLGRPQRRRMWLRRSAMKAPSAPQEDLSEFDVEAVNVDHRVEPNSLCGHVSVFECVVGSLKVTCEIEHEVSNTRTSSPYPGSPGRYPSSESILGAADGRYYGDGYKFRRQTIANLDVDPDNQYIECQVRVTPIGFEGLRDDGFGGHYSPSVTMVDCFLSLAQLTQVLIYRLDGIDRSRSNTLWLRTLTMDSRTPYQPMLSSFTASVALTKSKTVGFRGGTWRTFSVSGQFQGIQLRITGAHQLPKRRPVDLGVRVDSPARPSDAVETARHRETA
jgi:hypothetical protein